MQAFITEGNGIAALEVATRDLPEPGRQDVLVRMTACALNYRDLLVVKGANGWKPPGPRVPVSDGTGVIVAVGAGVTRFDIGDRVIGTFLPRWLEGDLTDETYTGALGGPSADGVMAEFRLFDEQALVAAPSYMSDEEAATLPVAAVTAWHAVRMRSDVQPGQSVVVQGTGGVSLFALQFVHAIGGRPIVLSSSERKLERARELGADVTINYADTPQWETEVLAATDGLGADHIIEVVGGENLNRSLGAVRINGSISFIGLLAGLAAPIHTYQFVTRNVDIHGIETGSRAMFEDLCQFMSEHEIRPIIDSAFEFEQFPAALEYLQSRRHFGKIVIGMPPAERP